MADLDLGAMAERARVAADHPTWSVAYAEDVPALLAEVERLRKESDEVLDLQRDAMGAEIRRLAADADSFARCHVQAVHRYAGLTRDLLILASKGRWSDLLERMGDDMDACDCVDEESEALYALARPRAKVAQVDHGGVPPDAPGYEAILAAYEAEKAGEAK